MSPARRPRFGLDQNFPTPVIEALREYIAEAELVPIGDLHPRLPTLDDWQLLHVLGEQSPTCDGLITTDNSMLLQDRELTALIQAKLTLVVADAAGDDPIKATGLLLAHLPWIAKQRHRHKAQIWLLRTLSKPAEDPWERLRRIAEQQGKPDPRALTTSTGSHRQRGWFVSCWRRSALTNDRFRLVRTAAAAGGSGGASQSELVSGYTHAAMRHLSSRLSSLSLATARELIV